MAPDPRRSSKPRSPWVLAILCLVLPGALLLGGFALLRWHAFGDPQRAALALMEPRPAPAGENAYPWLALSDYEVPLDQIDEAMAAEVRHYREWTHKMDTDPPKGPYRPGAPGWPDRDFRAKSRYGEREPIDAGSSICLPYEDMGCLEQVRARPEAFRTRLAREQDRLAMMDRALAATHLTLPFPPNIRASYLTTRSMELVTVRAALAAVDGRGEEAFSQACTQMASLRRLSASADTVWTRRWAHDHALQAGKLVLELRREHPSQPLPEVCATALAPSRGDEYRLCRIMRHEFAVYESMHEAGRRSLLSSGPYLLHRLMGEDATLRKAWEAQRFAGYCSDEGLADTDVLERQPVRIITSRDLGCYAAARSCHWVMKRHAPVHPETWNHDHYASMRLLLAAHELADGGTTEAATLARLQLPGYPVVRDRLKGRDRWSVKMAVYVEDTWFRVDVTGLPTR